MHLTKNIEVAITAITVTLIQMSDAILMEPPSMHT